MPSAGAFGSGQTLWRVVRAFVRWPLAPDHNSHLGLFSKHCVQRLLQNAPRWRFIRAGTPFCGIARQHFAAGVLLLFWHCLALCGFLDSLRRSLYSRRANGHVLRQPGGFRVLSCWAVKPRGVEPTDQCLPAVRAAAFVVWV